MSRLGITVCVLDAASALSLASQVPALIVGKTCLPNGLVIVRLQPESPLSLLSAASSAAIAARGSTGSTIAYWLTTSGTTRAEPSLVAVTHACIVPNIRDFVQLFALQPGDTSFLAAPLTFDPSVVEIFSTLSAGARLLVVPDRVRQSPVLLANALLRNRVSFLSATPSLMFRYGGMLFSCVSYVHI